jgi:hypothetical protein
MERHMQVIGTEIKVQIEQALNTKEMQPAIDVLEELFRHEIIELPWWIDGIIIEKLRSAGVDIKKNGGLYRCIAAYLLIPKMTEIVEFERKYTKNGEDNIFEDENLVEQWFEIVKDSVSIAVNSIYSEFGISNSQ